MLAYGGNADVVHVACIDKTSTRLQTLHTLVGHDDSIRSIAYDPATDMLATVGDDGCLGVWGLSLSSCQTARSDGSRSRQQAKDTRQPLMLIETGARRRGKS